jgi:hypothetical protein
MATVSEKAAPEGAAFSWYLIAAAKCRLTRQQIPSSVAARLYAIQNVPGLGFLPD